MSSLKPAITVDVNATMSVDKTAAERALKIVEWYCNDNSMRVVKQPYYDGSFTLTFECDLKPDGT